MNKTIKKVACALLISAILPFTIVNADANEDWQYGVSIYGWFPDISGETSVPSGGGDDFTIPIGDILDNLKFTFQGSFDARKGHWGLFTDVIYMDLGSSQKTISQGNIGGTDLPYDVEARVRFDMKSWIWTTAGYYRLVDQPERTFDMVLGVRYMDVSQSLDWSLSGNVGEIPIPGREGDAKIGSSYWDAIVGMRGRFAFGQDNSWFIPYYLDVGTGDSDVTWQAAGGIGYTFGWGDVAAVWRYLDYDLPSGKPIGEMNFSGPAIGAVIRW